MDEKQLPKAYEAKQYEDEIYAAWEKSGFFNPDNLKGKPFTIMMPPPNVTGVLHLGHALENALMDCMARYQRMRGEKVLLIPGTDHAALPTQAKVEKMLMQKGMKNPRQELGRDKLVEKIREFAEESRTTILSQIKKIGTSCDWSRLAYTFDDARNRAVNELFCRMYKDGLIYRGYRVVNWSVKGQSTSSDDEIIFIERPAKLYTFKYSSNFPIAIATTRPETKLGDTAVAVHPSDSRYAPYIGQVFTVDVGAAKPLQIKIIADEQVDPEFGTGALGVTPAHSSVDFAMYEKQKAKGEPIDLIPVIGLDGKMTAEAGADYVGLSVEEARAKFVLWLKEQNLLLNEEDITQNVGTSDRYGDVIESIPMTQWWLDVNKKIPSKGKSLCDLMREAVTTGLDGDSSKIVTITPDRFKKLYLDRVDHLRDWCLSRQIWWGHRIPVWYKQMSEVGDQKSETIFVGATAPEGDGWQQDPDTLDTWFSSGSWTFSTLGWPEQTKDLKTFHPTQWIQMGYEILYLWLMRMILMSAYALDEIPFKDAYIHGMLRDKNGNKFSKSSGNGIDPIDVIDEYGSDALRISLLIGTSPGNDARYYTEKIESGRNFVNKLWNISRFVLTSTDMLSPELVEGVKPQTLADRWILSRFATVTKEVTDHLEKYEFSQAGEKLRDFTWNEFADWYLEIAKIQKQEERSKKNETDKILLYILQNLLILWHPFMPFVTEVIWKNISKDLLIVQPWPSDKSKNVDQTSEQNFSRIQQLIVAIRNIRAQYKVRPEKKVDIRLQSSDKKVRQLLQENITIIKTLARANDIEITDEIAEPKFGCALAALEKITIHVMLPNEDLESEMERIKKECQSLEVYIKTTETKLENKEFVSNAPAHIVATMKAKLQEAKEKFETICTQFKKQNNK
ncbi:valine--tRNA ligase [Candidatus Uhrbacteria bacterium]|nr:valine--tRNA ligase [Candidatus Uhrbacteria bacterium]